MRSCEDQALDDLVAAINSVEAGDYAAAVQHAHHAIDELMLLAREEAHG